MPRAVAKIKQPEIVDAFNEAIKLGPRYGVELKPTGAINIIKTDTDSYYKIRPFAQKYSSVVYFIKCENFIKIGYATDANKRLLSMRTGNPFKMELLKTVAGDSGVEKKYHWQFNEYHHQFEWFRYEGRLKEWLEGWEK